MIVFPLAPSESKHVRMLPMLQGSSFTDQAYLYFRCIYKHKQWTWKKQNFNSFKNVKNILFSHINHRMINLRGLKKLRFFIATRLNLAANKSSVLSNVSWMTNLTSNSWLLESLLLDVVVCVFWLLRKIFWVHFVISVFFIRKIIQS